MKHIKLFEELNTIEDYKGNIIPMEDAVWCEIEKAWCNKKEAEWVNYIGFYTLPSYQSWCKKLDDVMKKNDISEFSKIYNTENSEYREKYKNERPEYRDVIDGSDIGLFSLKEERDIDI